MVHRVFIVLALFGPSLCARFTCDRPVILFPLVVCNVLCFSFGIYMKVSLSAENEEAKASTNKAKEDDNVKALRKACKDTLHLSTVVLSDSNLRFVTVMVVRILAPLREWQSEQSKMLRSCEGVRQWYCSKDLGAPFSPLQMIARTFVASNIGAVVSLGCVGVHLATVCIGNWLTPWSSQSSSWSCSGSSSS